MVRSCYRGKIYNVSQAPLGGRHSPNLPSALLNRRRPTAAPLYMPSEMGICSWGFLSAMTVLRRRIEVLVVGVDGLGLELREKERPTHT